MENAQYEYIGVDISKEKIDGSRNGHAFSVSNKPSALEKFCQDLTKEENPFVLFESTGHYHYKLMLALHKAGIVFACLNPRMVRDFARARGLLAKTDELDAELLVDFGNTMRPNPSELPSESHQRLYELVTRRDSLTQDRVREGNRLEASRAPVIRVQIQRHIDFLKAAVSEIELEIESLLKSDEQLRAKQEVLTEVKCIGPKVSTALLCFVPELGTLSRNQVSALVGLAPFNCDSGKHRGIRRTWGGREKARKALFQAAVVASRRSEVLAPIYQKMVAEGKPKKVALVAIARKMAIHLNTRLREYSQECPSTKPAKPELLGKAA